MIIRPISIALTMAIILMLTAAAPAQVPSIAPPQVTPPAGAPEVGAKTSEMPAQQAHALTKEDVEAWLDGFLRSPCSGAMSPELSSSSSRTTRSSWRRVMVTRMWRQKSRWTRR